MEEINDMDAKLVYEQMRNQWHNLIAEKEFEEDKKKYLYKCKCFISWFLNVKIINIEDD